MLNENLFYNLDDEKFKDSEASEELAALTDPMAKSGRYRYCKDFFQFKNFLHKHLQAKECNIVKEHTGFS